MCVSWCCIISVHPAEHTLSSWLVRMIPPPDAARLHNALARVYVYSPVIRRRQVRAMVRDMETFYPRKDDMGNGPIELVLGNVLDKVSRIGQGEPSDPAPEVFARDCRQPAGSAAAVKGIR